MRDRNDDPEENTGRSPLREGAGVRKKARVARKRPRQRPSFFDEEQADAWGEAEPSSPVSGDEGWEATVAAAMEIEAEAGRPAEPEEYEDADAEPEVERVTVADTDDHELRPARTRRDERPGGGGGRRVPLALPLAIAGALLTVVVAGIFTSLSKIDYTDFVFWLVLFTLAAHFDLKLRGGGMISLGIAPLLGALIALPVNIPDVPYSKIAASGCVQVVWIFVLGTIVTMITRMFSELTREDVVGLLTDLTGVGFMALVFYVLMQLFPQKPELLGHYTPALLVTLTFCGGALYAFYLLKLTYMQAQEGYFSPGLYLQSAVRRSLLPFLTICLLGTLMGMVFVGIGIWWVLFALPLLLALQYAFNRVAATDLYLLETIRVLAAIPEETGMIERGHAESVARLSEGVAQELGLSPEDKKQIEYAAYLHDIGAITRGADVDEDQRQLTETEGVITGGVDILGQVEYLGVAAEILRGREGLRDRVEDVDKRRAVSVGAGILKAVDDFESLLRGEEGREPMSESAALTEMNLERGVRYDSKVLRAIARVCPRLPKEGLTPSVGGFTEESEFWSEQ